MNETNEQARLVAKAIIKKLTADIRDRRGLGDEWEQISPSVMDEELIPAWTNIIAKEIAKASGQQPEAAPTAEAIAGSLKQPCCAWRSVSKSQPADGQRVICKYDGVYDARIVTFWRDDGGNTHFGLPGESDGKGSQPATHWTPLP